MKKVLVTLAGLVLATSAVAEEAAKVDINGNFTLKYFSATNAKLASSSDAGSSALSTGYYTNNHFRQITDLIFTVRKGENLGFIADVKNVSLWGDTDGALTAATPGYKDKNTTSNNFMAQELYGWWKATDNNTWKFGRFGMTVADGRLVSVNPTRDRGAVGEGIASIFEWDMLRLTLAGVKGADYGNTTLSTSASADATTVTSATGGSKDPEINYYAAVLDFKSLPDWVKMANLHILQKNVDRIGASSGQSVMWVGGVFSGEMNNFDFRATVEMQSGKSAITATTDTNSAASMYDLEVGYSLSEFWKSRFSAQYHTDTGDDPSTTDKNEGFDGFYYDKKANGGHLEFFTWGNLTYIKLGWEMKPMDDLTAELGYYMFSRTSDKATNTNAAGAGGGYNAAAGGNVTAKDVGSEIDLSVKKDYAGGFWTGLEYGILTPGAYLKKSAAGADVQRDNYSRLYLKAGFKF